MARRHLTQEQKRGLIREQLIETPEVSDRQIAVGLGVSHHTVGRQREEMESTGQIAQLSTNMGADGKERPREVQRKPVSVFNPTGRELTALQNPAVVEKLESAGQIAQLTRCGNSAGVRENRSDGKEYPRKHISVFNPTAREMHVPIRHTITRRLINGRI